MCLSTVIEVRDGEEITLGEYVSSVEVKDGALTLTDIMGREINVSGSIKSVDLVKNTILVAP